MGGRSVAPGADGRGTVAARADDLGSDLAVVARGGLLNLVGAVVGGILQFLLVVVVTRVLDTDEAGAFFVAIAMFSILSNTSELGADTGLVRTIPRLRATRRLADLPAAIGVGLVPVVTVASVLAVVVFALSGPMAELLSHDRNAADVEPYLRTLAPFLPLAAAYAVTVAATRGFGTMLPSVAIDKLAKPALQPLLVLVAAAVGAGAAGVALAWGGPIGLGLAAAAVWLVALERRVRRAAAGEDLPPASPRRRVASEFWRFTAPRGLAGFFQVGILWLDTLLLGALRSTRDAGVYAASTRYLIAGTFATIAIVQVTAPKISELFAHHAGERARSVYQAATAWLMLMTWPIYLTIAIFAPVLLGLFGEPYVRAAVPLLIIAVAMMISAATGPVDVVLLMAGRSTWNLFNTVLALTANVVLNLLLIPRLGITGAAIAWATSILLNNLVPLAQVWRFLDMHPFGPGFPRAATLALLCFGGIGLASRLLVGATAAGLAIAVVLGGGAYLLLLRRNREPLELPVLGETLRARSRGSR